MDAHLFASTAAVEPDDAVVAAPPGPEEDDIAAGYVPISYPSDDEGEGGGAAAAAAASAASPTAGESADAESLRSPISELEDKMRELPAPSSPGAVSRDEVEEAAAAAQLQRVQRENAELRKTLDSPVQPYRITTSARVYGCGACGAHIAMEEDVVSKDFCGSTGRAYFVNQVFNVNLGPVHECVFKTGKHVIADLFCQHCDTTLSKRTVVGWKYLKTGVRSQKYKEGKYVVEEAMLTQLGWSGAE